MSMTLSNTNYNGEVLEHLYLVLGVGNEVAEKGAAKFYGDISTKKALPNLSQTADPIGDYVAAAPSSETVTTTYAERELVMQKMTLYEKFVPTTFHDLWDKWKSVGDFSNLELNAELANAVIDLYRNGIGTQMSKLFWQGDTSLAAGNALNKFDGIVTRAIADASVIKPTPQGNITTTSFVDILAATWAAIPDIYLDDPDFVLNVNTTDWKTMQTGNTDLKKDFEGVFGMDLQTMYNEKRIRHFQGMTRHHIIGARSTTDDTSNLVAGVWVDPMNENFVIDKVANNSREWFFRLDMKADANYRESSEIVLYEPA